MARTDPTERSSPHAAGLLVLGMHRSGTSALARALALCGADIGVRLLGASAGNEAGHWEDAFAVEAHERLLAACGAAWDAPLSLPEDWRAGEPGRAAAREVAAYVAGDRAAHPLWAVKDPRLSLFAPLWVEAAREAGQALGAVLVLRHPLEVAASLAQRDGIGTGRALLLWLEYTIEAVAAAEALPHAVVAYDALLDDWRACIARLRALPGGEALRTDGEAAAAVDAFLDRGLRHHHRAPDDAAMPALVAEAWTRLTACLREGRLAPGTAAALRAGFAPARELVHAFADEARVGERRLWERVGRAEAVLGDVLAGERTVPADLRALREAVQQQHSALVEAISGELRHMQDVAAAAVRDAQRHLEEAGRQREQARLAHEEARLAREEARVAREETEQARREAAATQARLAEEAAIADARWRELSYEAARLREQAATLALVLRSRSWRWTRPFRVALRLLCGRAGPDDARELRRRWHALRARLPFAGGGAGVAAPAAGAIPAAPVPAPVAPPALRDAEPGLADVFVWAVIDWHFRTQRPQHLARALARRGHRVFYVSNNFEDAAGPGFRAEPLDASGRLFQVHLNLAGNPPIYHAMPDAAQAGAIQASLAELLGWTGTRASMSLVQHPYWSPFARMVPNARVVYDCMDHHAGFDDNAPAVIRAEQALVEDADLVVVTSQWLEREVGPRARNTALVRNAGDAAFFAAMPAEVFRDPDGRRVIGYFGAIAEWFDVALVRKVALANPGALVLLIGSDTVGAAGQLAGLPNVRMVGEVPYTRLPYWLHGFDVALLPFRVVELTMATNPVKVYEYLAAGKPVVAVDLPEMAQFDGLVRVARDHDAFVAAVGEALASPGSPMEVEARKRFAEGQTWEHRALELDEALASIREPLVSVVVLAYNNLAFTQACLASIEACSDYPNLEVIVVDNASSDGSVDWLRGWERERSAAGHRRRLIANDANLGFAAGNNVGLRAASGDYLVMLNNDTRVTHGWVRTLCAHLRRDPTLGLVGPVTNNIGNEAKIDIAYDDPADMHGPAGEYTRRHPGRELPLRTAAFFCVAMRREVFEHVGELDEAFGVGFFEDDDYCRRVEQAGWRIACAEDVFVHHHLSASFDALRAERRKALFEANKALYEAKWGPWEPHAYRGGSMG